jgi:hypothetical protein
MRYTQLSGLIFFFVWYMYLVPAAIAQEGESSGKTDTGDIAALVGLTLEELVSRFGLPQSVHAVRGHEPWQDDVVFIYEAGDFYVYKDRVWQIEVKTAYGIKIGDNLGAISWMLGEGTQMYSDYFLIPLRGHPWPLMLRINITSAGVISGIFIYRPDF